MANIKFSQFTVGNTESDIDFVVGYKGANNIQISPANLLSATLSGYLPLTGGTMTGNIKYNSGVRAQFGSSSNAEILFNGSDLLMSTFAGDMLITNYADDKDIVFQSDDGSGGVTEYFRLDGSTTSMQASKNIVFADNIRATFGGGADMAIYHNSTSQNGIIENFTNDLIIQNNANDEDIVFKCDDGSGGVTEYFRVDGSSEITIASKPFRFNDGIAAQFGTGLDMQIYHSGGEGTIQNYVGNLRFIQSLNDGDIQFFSDDGSGSTTEYFRLDGSLATGSRVYTVFPDNSTAVFGSGFDFQIHHDASNTYLQQGGTGDLYFQQNVDNRDIIFQADNGSGGVMDYLRLDGSDVRINVNASNGMQFMDNVRAKFGTSGDLNIYHDGSNSRIQNITGDIRIINFADDKDIIFQSDDGSGGVTEYFKLDGTNEVNKFSKHAQFLDSIEAKFGNGGDLRMYHGGVDSYIVNETGNLQLIQKANNKDIQFFSDDGSGGFTEYFRLDGGSRISIFSKNARFLNGIYAMFGSSNQLLIFHDGTDAQIFNTGIGGDLVIRNDHNDKDIRFLCDDGSGGSTDYFRLDGSDGNVKVYKQFGFLDNVKATFGNSGDLEVYHSGSHSFINGSNGAGSLYLRPGAGGTIQLETPAGVDMINASATDVRMYASGNERVRVKNIGINIQNVPTYADNTAAIAGGLTTGDVYRTGDLLKIVH